MIGPGAGWTCMKTCIVGLNEGSYLYTSTHTVLELVEDDLWENMYETPMNELFCERLDSCSYFGKLDEKIELLQMRFFMLF
mmetsp:Transcript_41261/g.98797  ORF Transcript_41261/g.98797 Transcript_41261/m.98797 type:complete len:81 (+) Transcript_41261:97-339(+)